MAIPLVVQDTPPRGFLDGERLDGGVLGTTGGSRHIRGSNQEIPVRRANVGESISTPSGTRQQRVLDGGKSSPPATHRQWTVAGEVGPLSHHPCGSPKGPNMAAA